MPNPRPDFPRAVGNGLRHDVADDDDDDLHHLSSVEVSVHSLSVVGELNYSVDDGWS